MNGENLVSPSEKRKVEEGLKAVPPAFQTAFGVAECNEEVPSAYGAGTRKINYDGKTLKEVFGPVL